MSWQLYGSSNCSIQGCQCITKLSIRVNQLAWKGRLLQAPDIQELPCNAECLACRLRFILKLLWCGISSCSLGLGIQLSKRRILILQVHDDSGMMTSAGAHDRRRLHCERDLQVASLQGVKLGWLCQPAFDNCKCNDYHWHTFLNSHCIEHIAGVRCRSSERPDSQSLKKVLRVCKGMWILHVSAADCQHGHC